MANKVRLPRKYVNILMRRTCVSSLNIMIKSEISNKNNWTFVYGQKRRFFSHPCLDAKTPSLPNLEPNDQKSKKSAIKERLFGKFFDYIKGYELILEKLLPEVALRYYKIFSNGTKSLFTDMKEFIYLYRVLSSTSDWEKGCQTMTRKQLELYLTLPAELLRVAPVLIISAFPMAQNVAFPLALWAPKRLLSIHFWSDEIKQEVDEANLKLRQSFYRHVFKSMVAISSSSYGSYSNSPRVQGFFMTLRRSRDKNTEGIPKALQSKEERNAMYLDFQNNTKKVMKDHDKLYICYRDNMRKLVTGKHPDVGEILSMAPYFRNTDGPLSLTQLPATHLRSLLKIHNKKHVGITSFLSVRTKLQVYANMIHQIDMAIIREGLNHMDTNDIYQCCMARGLNVYTISEAEAKDYLEQWLRVSSRLDNGTSSLLLHLPIFLGYNHKSRFSKEKTS